ncbi:MAG: DUF3575 domain-containing protein [Sediminibacterium sp.]
MKKIFFMLLVSVSNITHAQSLIGGNNIIKTNLSSDALNNYNITFERSISRFMSVSLSYRKMNKQKLPLKELAKQFIQNDAIDFDKFEIGNSAITAEARFYIGMSKLSGIYLAPYARSATFDVTVPLDYTYTPVSPVPNVTLPPIPMHAQLDGTIRSTSYGLYTGMQFQLLTKIVLDLWIIGGHYGTSNGKLIFVAPAGTPALALSELKKTIDQTKTNPFTLKTVTTPNGVMTDTEGPSAGIRGVGVTGGFRC